MDDVYKGLSKEETIEMVYDLTLQNTNGRENALEMYKLGIEACYEELCEANVATSVNSLHKHIVTNRNLSDKLNNFLEKNDIPPWEVILFLIALFGMFASTLLFLPW